MVFASKNCTIFLLLQCNVKLQKKEVDNNWYKTYIERVFLIFYITNFLLINLVYDLYDDAFLSALLPLINIVFLFNL